MRAFLLVISLGLVHSLHADPIILKPPTGSPEQNLAIAISGVADGKPTTYKGSVWLVANQDVQSLQVVPSELTSADSRSIPISAIHLNSIALHNGIASELDVSIDAAVLPGKFQGNLQLLGSKGESVPPIPLTLELAWKPNIVVVPSTFAFMVSRCYTNLSCRINDFILPPALVGDVRSWQLQNLTPSHVIWTASNLTLRGDKTGDFIDNDISLISQVVPPAIQDLPTGLVGKDGKTGSTVPLFFKFDRGAIRPDHYQGQYRIQFTGSDPMVVPFTLDVRDGPLLPVMVLLLGIAAGRFVQSTNAPRLQSQMRLMDQYNLVFGEVDRLTDNVIAQSLRLRLSEVLVDIRNLAQPEAELTTQLNAILRLTSDSEKLDLVEPAINALADANLKATLLSYLADARTAILGADAPTAEQKLANITSSLGAGAVVVAGMPARMARAAAVAPPAPPNKPNMLIRIIWFLAGSRPISADWFFQWGRPCMFLLLLVLLVFVGLYNSYIRNATFGVESYFDYLSLFLWGLSADVAQRTLQNLSLNRS
jgi:hypothetical protein